MSGEGELPFHLNERSVEDALKSISTGTGVQVRSISEIPDLFVFIDDRIDTSLVLNNPNRILLTPLITKNPVIACKGEFQRGIDHDRSFSYAISGRDENVYSLTVKGGDIINSQVVEKHYDKIQSGEIPGGGVLEDCRSEFDYALALHSEAILKLGRLTYVPYPLAIRRIDNVSCNKGELVDVKNFVGSGKYIDLNSNRREFLGIQEGVRLEDVLFRRGLPHEYIYAIPGLNLRSKELQQIVLGPELIMQNEIVNTQDVAVRSVYKVLAEMYGFNENAILPADKMSTNMIEKQLMDIRDNCTTSHISERVINVFIDRICEVAALGHAAGYAFYEADNRAGGQSSFTSRNTTYAGIVCDLDTLRKFDADSATAAVRDFKDIILSISCMRKILMNEAPKDLGEQVVSIYLEKLHQFKESSMTIPIESAITQKSLIEGMRGVL